MTINPPHTNGVMELTDEEKVTIKTKLLTIENDFTPNVYQESIDTQYIVSTYNIQNKGNEINGDTAEAVLRGE